MLKKSCFRSGVCILFSVLLIVSYAAGVSAVSGPGYKTVDIENVLYASLEDSSRDINYFAGKFGISAAETERLKTVFLEAVSSYGESVDLSSFKIDSGALMSNVFNFGYFISDYTFFHVTWGSSIYDPNTGYAKKLKIKYTMDKETYDSYMKICAEKASYLKRKLSGLALSEEEKILYIHDWLCVNAEYDPNAGDKNKASPNNANICGPLVEGKAVCQGYSEAFLYLLGQFGIRSWMTGSGQLNHSWNIVQLSNGKRYYVDVTWDDPIWEDSNGDHTNYASHSWFMVSFSRLQVLGRTQTDYDRTNMGYTDLDKYVWKDVKQPFILLDGKLWYFDGADYSIRTLQNKKIVTEYKLDLSDAYNKNVSLSSYGSDLYFSLGDSVYIASGDGHKKQMSLSEKLGKTVYISSFYIKDGFACFNYWYFPDNVYKSETCSVPFTKANFPDMADSDEPVTTATEEPDDPSLFPGDVDGDGIIDTKDATLVLMADAKVRTLSSAKKRRADVSGDQTVDSADASLILKYDAGKIKSF